jgi:hypothetical protein
MAVTAASGGLILAAAGTAPAYAAAPAAQPAPHHKISMTFTARSAISPSTESPCAIRRGAGLKPAAGAGCIPETINCHLTDFTPWISYDTSPAQIVTTAELACDSLVNQISVSDTLLRSGAVVGTSLTFTTQGENHADSVQSVTCQPGVYVDTSQASVIFPPGFVLVGGSNPAHNSSSPLDVTTCAKPAPPGGGCVVRAPSPAGHPAGRRPHIITC